MGFSIPTAARVPLQGETKRVMRWDLMRPEMFPKTEAVSRKPGRPRLSIEWKERALAELPKEVSDLARCQGRYWKNKTLATLRRDYRRGSQLASEVPVFVRQIAEQIAAEYGFPACLLFGRTKVTRVVEARQDLCFALRQYTLPNGRNPAMTKIAKWVGFQDHTSVGHALGAKARRAG